MKDFTSFMIICILVLSGCYEDDFSDCVKVTRPEYELETLRISEESLSYLDYYRENDKLVFVKLEEEYNSYQKPEYWIFTKQGPAEKTYADHGIWTSSVDEGTIIINGLSERIDISFVDTSGSILKVGCDMMVSVKDKETWNMWSERLNITYEGEFKTRLLRHVIKEYNVYDDYICPPRATTVLDSIVIGNKVYRDVIKFLHVKEKYHYDLFATKDEGIIRIDDLNKKVTWVTEN